MADSVPQAGPMVQMILARRDAVPFFWIGLSSGCFELGFKIPRQELTCRDAACDVSVRGVPNVVRETLQATSLRLGAVDRR